MKIMTYNILYGGVDENGSRVEHIIAAINEERPDFVAIQEADNFDKDAYALLKRISKETNLPHYALAQGALHSDNQHHHVVCLSRFPLHDSHTFPNQIFQSAALSVAVDSPWGKLSFCCVHLHSTSEDERIREVNMILDHQSKYKHNIILGDHNALSRLDNHHDLSAKEFTSYDLNGFDATDTLRARYTAAAEYLNIPDRSTHPTIGVGHPISKTPIRIDYIWLANPLLSHLTSAAVIKTPTTELASDHYPVTITLE